MTAEDRRLHVLQIVGNAIVGGMESHVRQLVERLPAAQFRFTVLAPYASPFTEALGRIGADVHVTPIADQVGWQSLQYTCALIAAEDVDIVHAHLPNAHALGGLAGRLTARPVLATVHGRALTPLDIEVQRLTGSQLAVVCRACLHQALGVGIASGDLHLLPIGVDTARFQPRARPDPGWRSRLGIDDADPLVGFVGRLSWEKGPDLFVRTAQAVRSRCPRAHFLLVGEGPMHEELALLVERSGLASAVHFAGLQTDMPSIYREFDLAVSTSRSEATPFAVLEAMACGIAVAAFSVGAVPELIENGISGWLAAERDVDGLAERIVAVLTDPARRHEAGAAARRRVLERFDADAALASTARVLQVIGASRHEGRPRPVAAPSVVDLVNHVRQNAAPARP